MAQDNKEYLDGIGVEEKVRKPRPKENGKCLAHKALCKELHDLYYKKSNDYGDSFGATYRQLGIASALVRISDKYNRLMSLGTGKEQMVNDESIRDTLIDLANYSLMTILELDYENRKKQEKKNESN